MQQLTAAFAQASILAVRWSVVRGRVTRELIRTRKAAASCRIPEDLLDWALNLCPLKAWQLGLSGVLGLEQAAKRGSPLLERGRPKCSSERRPVANGARPVYRR